VDKQSSPQDRDNTGNAFACSYPTRETRHGFGARQFLSEAPRLLHAIYAPTATFASDRPKYFARPRFELTNIEFARRTLPEA
jgi:hypothetical protein